MTGTKHKQSAGSHCNSLRHKINHLLLLLAMLCASVSASAAYDFKVDGVYYKILSKSTCAVSYSSTNGSYHGSVTIPEEVTLYGSTYKVTAVADSAFYYSNNMTDVSLPSSITTLGKSAFYFCTGLTSINIPSSVTGIGPNTFAGCNSLTSLSIPSSVTSISSYAFSGCSNIAELTIEDSETTLKIGNNAFSRVALTSLYLGRNLDDTPFKNNSTLQTVLIGENVTALKWGAFSGCTALEKVITPNLTAWCNIDFESADANPLYYAHHLFINEDEVTDLTIPQSISKLRFTFDGASALTSVTFPTSLREIGYCAFYGCSGLTTVTIPNTVTSIGEYAFEGCTGLGSITFEDGNTNLSVVSTAFSLATPKVVVYGRQMDFTTVPCTALEEVEFGEKVTAISNGAFSDASLLRSVTSRSMVPPTIGESTFADDTYNKGALYVKNDAMTAYGAATGWKNFQNIQDVDNPTGIAAVDNDSNDTQVSIDGGTICINGVANTRIVSMNGTTIYSGRGDIRINVTPGLYIVKIGNAVTKVAVK